MTLDPANSNRIDREFADFCALKAKLGIYSGADVTIRSCRKFMDQHLLMMSRAAAINQPSYESAQCSRFIRFCRRIVLFGRKILIKLGFLQQQNFNDLTVVLAHSVVMLERKVELLQEQIKAQQ